MNNQELEFNFFESNIYTDYFDEKNDFFPSQMDSPVQDSYEESIHKEFEKYLMKAPSSTCGSS